MNKTKAKYQNSLQGQDLKKYHLPAAPGVYIFKQNKAILYVGKATSLKDRVKSYFSRDPKGKQTSYGASLIQTRGPLIVQMVELANKIDYIKTESVLEAIILEANLIKKYQPKYNTKEKDNKSFNYVIITVEDFPRILIARGRNLFSAQKGLQKFSACFGPYTNSNQLKAVLKIIRKIFPFRDRCVPMSGKPCFNKQLGLCPGVCDGSISKKDYLKIIRKIKLLLSGRINSLKKDLNKEMKSFAKNGEYEKARVIRDQIFALEHIQDVSLLSAEHNLPLTPSLSGGGNGVESPLTRGLGNYRLEAYDVAHLSGTNNVGVMVVMEDGEFKKSDYRKFKIRNTKGDDIGALKEILERRLKHSEWPTPNIIVVDGGSGQFNAAKRIVNQGSAFGMSKSLALIFIAAVTKNERHRPKAIIGSENLVKKYQKEILQINNEAHRFAIAFHRQKRNVIL